MGSGRERELATLDSALITACECDQNSEKCGALGCGNAREQIRFEIVHGAPSPPRDTSPGLGEPQSLGAPINHLRERPLLSGYRGSLRLDLPALADLIARLAQVLGGDPSIREIGLNPVSSYPAGQGVMALYALMVIQRPEP